MVGSHTYPWHARTTTVCSHTVATHTVTHKQARSSAPGAPSLPCSVRNASLHRAYPHVSFDSADHKTPFYPEPSLPTHTHFNPFRPLIQSHIHLSHTGPLVMAKLYPARDLAVYPVRAKGSNIEVRLCKAAVSGMTSSTKESVYVHVHTL